MKVLKYLGLTLVFLWFLVGGISHFRNPDFFLAIMPPYLPFHAAAVYVSGVFEVIGAMAIWPPRTRSVAGWGLIVLTVLVTPANVRMWLHPELFPEVSPTFLGGRLVVQVLLLALIWWSTRPMSVHPRPSPANT